MGVRSYLAVAGGFEVPATLGSRSTDLLSGLGPPVLWAGQRLAVGPAHSPPPAIDFAPYRLPPSDLVLPLHPGPRHDWLTEQGKVDLFAQSYRVSPAEQPHRAPAFGSAARTPRGSRSCPARASSGGRCSC